MRNLAALALAPLAAVAPQDNDPAPERLIPTLVTSFGGSQSEAVTAAACDGDTLWIAGRTHSEDGPVPAREGVHGFVVRIDTVTGDLLLAVPIEAGVPRDVASGVAGSITVCGGTDDSDAFFVRLTSDGSVVQQESFGGPVARADAVAVHRDGSFAVAYLVERAPAEDNADPSSPRKSTQGSDRQARVRLYNKDGALLADVDVSDTLGRPGPTVDLLSLDGGDYLAASTVSRNDWIGKIFWANAGDVRAEFAVGPEEGAWLRRIGSDGSLLATRSLREDGMLELGAGLRDLKQSQRPQHVLARAPDGSILVVGCGPTRDPLASTSTFVGRYTPDLNSRTGHFELASDYNAVNDIAVDARSRVLLAGSTRDDAFPLTADAHWTGPVGDERDLLHEDGALLILSADLAHIEHATRLGGLGNREYAAALAVLADGRVAVTGSTDSQDLPTTHGAIHHGRWDAFLYVFPAGG